MVVWSETTSPRVATLVTGKFPNAVYDGDLNEDEKYWLPHMIYEDPGSYAIPCNGRLNAYAKESDADDWADVGIFQGRKLHAPGVFNTYLKNEWYIPHDVPDGEFILSFTVRNVKCPKLLKPTTVPRASFPTAGACVVLYFNAMALYPDQSTGWVFDWENPSYDTPPKNATMEVFGVRWGYDISTGVWRTLLYHPLYHIICDVTTHDRDIHMLLNTFEMKDLEWYGFTIDLSPCVRDLCQYIFEWFAIHGGAPGGRGLWGILGLRLYTVRLSVEPIGCDYAAQFDSVSIQLTNPRRFGDLNMDGVVGNDDLERVKSVYGKTHWDSDWESSGAKYVDYMLHYDGVVDDNELDVVTRNLGWQWSPKIIYI
jgi:hypothetical protein